MGIKTYNPYTPSRRQMTGSDFSEITKTTPEKSLLDSKKRKAGRNAQGKITVRHRGGGAKKKYRIVDFKRNKDGIAAKVIGRARREWKKLSPRERSMSIRQIDEYYDHLTDTKYCMQASTYLSDKAFLDEYDY